MIIPLQLLAYCFIKYSPNKRIIPPFVIRCCELQLTQICASKNPNYYIHIKDCDYTCVQYIHNNFKLDIQPIDIIQSCAYGRLNTFKYFCDNINNKLFNMELINNIIQEENYEKYKYIEKHINNDDLQNILIFSSRTLSSEIFLDIYKKYIDINTDLTDLIIINIIWRNLIVADNKESTRFYYNIYKDKIELDFNLLAEESGVGILKMIVSDLEANNTNLLHDMITPELIYRSVGRNDLSKVMYITNLVKKYYIEDDVEEGLYDFEADLYTEFVDINVKNIGDCISEAITIATINNCKICYQYLLSR